MLYLLYYEYVDIYRSKQQLSHIELCNSLYIGHRYTFRDFSKKIILPFVIYINTYIYNILFLNKNIISHINIFIWYK